MKVLGIVGSKRRHGNTSELVQEALSPFKNDNDTTELIFLDDYNIEGCRGCEGCRETFKCIVNDDMQRLYPLLLEADALILGSPTYFYNVSADIKAFIDRCYCLVSFDATDRSVWVSLNEARGGKYAIVIDVCEQSREEDMGHTADTMEMTLQCLGYRITDTVKVMNAFAAGEVCNDKSSMKKAKEAGRKLLKTLILRKKIQ